MPKHLIGLQVVIQGNDFIRLDSPADIVQVDAEAKKLLLELCSPLNEGGQVYRYAVASPRLSRDTPSLLAETGTLGCSITWVPESRFDSDKPMDLSGWRGGAAAIADIRVRSGG